MMAAQGTVPPKSWKKARPGAERRIKFSKGRLGWLNDFFNKGLLCGGTYIIHGGPNAGKTTLTKQMADDLASQGHTVYFRDQENTMKSSVALNKRLELTNDWLLETKDSGLPKNLAKMDLEEAMKWVTQDNQDPDMEVMYKVMEMAKEMRNNTLKEGKFIWIVDSLQSLAGGSRGAAFDIAMRFGKLAQALDAVCIFISQVNKKGEMAGYKALEHEVDGVADLEVLTNNGTQDQWRLLRWRKHRAGPTAWEVTNLASAGHVHMEKEYVKKNSKIVGKLPAD